MNASVLNKNEFDYMKIWSLKYYIVFSLALFAPALFAQSTRSYVNKGVDLYKEGKAADSEVEFKKGLEKSPNNFQANFNLGDSYYKEQNYPDALKAYSSALSKTNNNLLKAKVYHNIGNALLQSKKYKESVNAYANSLKLNPNDQDTKYNLSYALSMMKNPDKNKNQNKNNKNDKNKKNQDNKNQNKNDQNKNDQNKNQNQNQNQNNQQNQNKNQQNQGNNGQSQDKISKQQAETILNAIKNDEKDLQKQVRKIKGTPVKTDKDW